MQLLYSDQSLLAIHRKLRRRLIVLYIVLAVLLAVFVYAMIVRIEWLAMVAASVAGCFAIFWVDMFCLPLIKYRRLVRSALSGRTHTETLEFDHVEPDLSVVDGVPCRSLIFLGEPDKHGTRDQLYYWDAELPLPSFRPGEAVTMQYTGKNIIGVAPADQSSRP